MRSSGEDDSMLSCSLDVFEELSRCHRHLFLPLGSMLRTLMWPKLGSSLPSQSSVWPGFGWHNVSEASREPEGVLAHRPPQRPLYSLRKPGATQRGITDDLNNQPTPFNLQWATRKCIHHFLLFQLNFILSIIHPSFYYYIIQLSS